MNTPIYTDAEIVAGIAEATAAWQSAPSTTYLVQRFGYRRPHLLRRLQRMERAGLVARAGRGAEGWTWRVM